MTCLICHCLVLAAAIAVTAVIHAAETHISREAIEWCNIWIPDANDTKLRDLKHWFHAHLTTPLSEVWAALNAKLRGHYQYYGINDNWPWLMKFRGAAKKLAFRWLNRRSQSKSKTWHQFYAYLDRFPLATPKKLTDLIAMARSR